jgi:hypothetical protein
MAEMIFPPILQVALVKNRQKMQEANLDSELSNLPGEIIRLIKKFFVREKQNSPEITIHQQRSVLPCERFFLLTSNFFLYTSGFTG